jgi:murein L,D-transpeptidase YafK
VIVVRKAARRLGLYRGGALVEGACWEIALAAGYPAGHKTREGDLRTPEGWYRTSDKPNSSFYGAIAVHYPGVEDARTGERDGAITGRQRAAIEAALAAGMKPPQATALGGEILIHGGGAGSDWTLGCVAVEDAELDVLRARLPAGMATDVLILP